MPGRRPLPLSALIVAFGVALLLVLPGHAHAGHEDAHLGRNRSDPTLKYIARNLVLGNPIDVCIVSLVATVISVTGSRCAPPDFGNRSGDPIPGGGRYINYRRI